MTRKRSLSFQNKLPSHLSNPNPKDQLNKVLECVFGVQIWFLYVQVRFNLIYESEISYLTVHLHEKAWKDASIDITLKQEIKKVMVGHEKYTHLEKKKKLIIKTTRNVREKP